MGPRPEPLWMLLAVGLVYGLLLAVTHQLLWDQATGNSPPRLGDALHDHPEEAHDAVTRVGAVLSSLVTGAAMGALVGLLALAATLIRERRDRTGGRLR